MTVIAGLAAAALIGAAAAAAAAVLIDLYIYHCSMMVCLLCRWHCWLFGTPRSVAERDNQNNNGPIPDGTPSVGV